MIRSGVVTWLVLIQRDSIPGSYWNVKIEPSFLKLLIWGDAILKPLKPPIETRILKIIATKYKRERPEGSLSSWTHLCLKNHNCVCEEFLCFKCSEFDSSVTCVQSLHPGGSYWEGFLRCKPRSKYNQPWARVGSVSIKDRGMNHCSPALSIGGLWQQPPPPATHRNYYCSVPADCMYSRERHCSRRELCPFLSLPSESILHRFLMSLSWVRGYHVLEQQAKVSHRR